MSKCQNCQGKANEEDLKSTDDGVKLCKECWDELLPEMIEKNE